MATPIEKVRIELAKKRVRIEEHFADFDRLHSGAITPDQFKRSIAIAVGLSTLTEADVDALSRAFVAKDGLLVNYKAFMSAVNAEEVPVSLLSPTRTGRQIAPDMEAALAKMTEFFVHRITTTGLDVRQCFRDFDRHNCGKITIAQFERSFPFKIEPRFLKAIEEKYTDGAGSIMYLGWCNDVVNAVNGANGVSSKSYAETMAQRAQQQQQQKQLQLGDRSGVDVDRLLGELRSQMAAKRLRVDDQLRDYDKMHTGLITVPQFCACLGRLPLNRTVLHDAELEALAQHYVVSDSSGVAKVQYGLFVADVDQQLHPSPSLPVLSDNTLSPEEERQVAAVLDKVRGAVRTRRVNIKPTFQDFDRAIKGIYQSRSCTRTRFERALAINKINLSPAEVALLERKYAMVRADGTFEDDINYHSFCAAVDLGGAVPEPLATTVTGAATSAAATLSSSSSAGGSKSLQEVLDKAMLQAVDRRVRLNEFMRDFDPLHSGAIPNGKLASALGIAGLQLTQADLDAIFAAFAHATLPNFVNLPKFLAAVDTGVVVDNMEAPNSPVRDNESALRSRLRVTDEGAAGDRATQLEQIVQRVSETVRSKGILLPPFFHDYDKHHSGRITRTQFTQVLSRHRLPLSQSDVELLCKVYADQVDPLQIRYRGFIGAVDESENVAKQHALRATARAVGAAPGAAAAALSSTSDRAAADVEATLHKIVGFVQRRQARIEEFFHDSDPLRRGVVPEGKFRSALDMTGLLLTDAEHAGLVAAFRSAREDRAVEYHAFLKALDEAHPTVVASSAQPPQLDAFAARLIDKIRHSLESRRLITRPLFQDSDKLRKGIVSEAQFFAALTTINLRFAPIEADALRGLLRGENGTMRYNKFCELVDAPDA